MTTDLTSHADQAARIANLVRPFYEGLDHLGKHVYFRSADSAHEWCDACGWDYVLETTPGRIWRATQNSTAVL